MFNRIRCALGYHEWGGWSKIVDGKSTGHAWCINCNVAWGKPTSWNKDNYS